MKTSTATKMTKPRSAPVPKSKQTKSAVVSKNKQGQALGQKGAATRRRLLEAARRLLKTESPMELTAVSIAQQAKTSSATFYMYFDDVRDIMYALSEAAGEDIADVRAVLDEPWDASVVEVDRALKLIREFDSVWDQHREVLRYRNLEADRGDARFQELRTRDYAPTIERMADHIVAAYPAGKRPRRGDAYAEATVLYAALEALAAMDPKVQEEGLGVKRLQEALARIVAHVLGGRAEDDTWVAGNGRRTAEVQAAAKASARVRSLKK